MRRLAMRLAWPSLAAFLAGCTTLAFTAANAPALFGPFERHADLRYGNAARMSLDVYAPRGTLQPKPVVVFWYGGGWTSGSKARYRFVGAALAAAGYVAVLPDYRIYPQARFPAFLEDGAAAVRWVREHIADYGGDPDSIVLMGHSAGAHLAASLAWDERWLRAAGVPRRAIRALVGLSGPYELAPNTATLNAIFASPYSAADWQPLRYIDAQAPAALLLHGAADRLVWPRNATRAADALRAVGVPAEVRLYEARSHADTVAALSLPGRRRAPVLADLRRFLDAQLIAARSDPSPRRARE